MAKRKNNRKRARRTYARNQHAFISTSSNANAIGGGQSYTANREDELSAAIFTDSSNSTSLLVRSGDATVKFSGRQARTLQRLLNKHYATAGFSSSTPGVDWF